MSPFDKRPSSVSATRRAHQEWRYHPCLARTESSERRVYKPQFRQKRKRSRSPAGLRRLGTATRMSASLPRRLSAFFVSTLGQGPKAAKYTFLIPGPGMFVNVRNAPRVVIAAPSGRPLFRRVSRCVRSCWQRRVCTHFHPQKRMWAVLQAIATRAFLPCGTH